MITNRPGEQVPERAPQPSEIAFGDFRYNVLGRVLRHNGTPVAVPLRALGVLDELLERPGQIVSKEYLLERVWHDAAVTEHALTETVRVLRLLLANGDPERTFIETHYGRGFRFRASTIHPTTQPGTLVEASGPQAQGQRAVARALANGGWRRLAMTLAAGAALGAAAVGVLGPRGGESDGAARSLPQRRFQITDPGEIWGGLAISPDGLRVAYHSGDGLYIRSLDELAPVLVTDLPSQRDPFFSPDGQRIAFFRQIVGDTTFDLDVIDLVDGNRTTLCVECGRYTRWGLGGDWADDGSIVFAMDRGLWRIPETGGQPEPLLPVVEGQQYMWPKVLPGSQAVIFAIHRGSTMYGAQIAVMPLPSGPVRILVDDASSPVYAATGHLLFARDGKVLAAPFDIEQLELSGDPAVVLRDIWTRETTGYAKYAVSGEGSVLIQRGGMWTREVYQPVRIDTTGAVTDLEVEPGGFRYVRVSPDGRFLATHRMMRGDYDLWLIDLKMNALDRLTEGAAEDRTPVFSPDNTRVAFVSDREGTPGIYQVPLDRSREPELLLATERMASLGSWSPDGRTLTFNTPNEDGDNDMWLLPLDGDRTPRRLRPSADNEFAPMFSPDGRWLAYMVGANGVSNIYVTSLEQPGPVHRISSDGGAMPRWSRSGDRLFYRWNGLWSVPVSLTPEFRAGTPQVNSALGVGTDYDVHPDGTIFALQSRAPSSTTNTLEVVLNWFDTLRQASPLPER